MEQQSGVSWNAAAEIRRRFREKEDTEGERARANYRGHENVFSVAVGRGGGPRGLLPVSETGAHS